MVNRMDYKVEVKGKIKIYHANLLKRYYEREVDLAGVAKEEEADVPGDTVAVIDLEDGDEGDGRTTGSG